MAQVVSNASELQVCRHSWSGNSAVRKPQQVGFFNGRHGKDVKLLQVSCLALGAAILTGCASGPSTSLTHLAAPSRGELFLTRGCEFRRHGLVLHQPAWRNPGRRVLRVPRHAAGPIVRASRITGVGADYLALTASRESRFNNRARARTSTATGMFQFIEQTWLAQVAEDGPCLGLGSLVRYIRRDRNGQFRVSSPSMRRRILNLRMNPELSAILAARLAQKNAGALRKLLRRPPTYSELYIAHLLGPRSAAQLISLAVHAPQNRADRYFRRAARSNKPIFYKGWRPRTVRGVYQVMVREHANWRVVYPASAHARRRRGRTI